MIGQRAFHGISVEVKSTDIVTDGWVLNTLNELFENKCYEGCLILKVLEVVHRTDMRVDKSRSGGNGTIKVSFLAQVVTFGTDELIIGRIVHISSKYVQIASKYVNACYIFRGTGKLPFKSNQCIIFNCREFKYSIMRSKVTAAVNQVFAYPGVQAFDCTDDIDMEELKPYIENLQNIRSKLKPAHAKLNTSLRASFIDIAKKEKYTIDESKPKTSKTFSIVKPKLTGKIVRYDPFDIYVQPYKDTKNVLVSETGTNAYKEFLIKSINYIQVLLDYVRN